VKFAEEIMEILAAFDLTRSFRDAGELAGCSHHTVEHHVARREAGPLGDEPARRAQILDDFLDKIEEWVKTSHGKVRADVAHDKLVAMGYEGSERTSRRAVAAVKASYAAGNRRVYRPWIPEPGMWLQYDFGDGPTIDGRATTLFCAWLAWCRFRVVLAILDRTLPTAIACIDTTLRAWGAARRMRSSKMFHGTFSRSTCLVSPAARRSTWSMWLPPPGHYGPRSWPWGRRCRHRGGHER